MDSPDKKKRPWRQRIRDHYRLVVLNDETFQEVSSYRLNLMNLYILASTLMILIGLLVFAIIVYTPLKRVIPGYGDVNATPEFLELKSQTIKLEKELISIQTYIEANKNRLLGNPNNSSSNLINQAYKPEILDEIDTLVHKPEVEGVVEEEDIRFFFPPINGTISANHDADDHHFGIDILAPKDSPVSAILDGAIIASEYNIETGNTISIQHENNIVSTYKHNSVLLKKVGDYVKAGEAIAIVGNTGTQTDGAHLHFELWIEGRSINPNKYINFSN